MDSKALGQFVLPAMEELPKRISRLSAAVLCTPDGFNICSLGVDERQVGKLAAMSSSLLAVGDAAVAELHPELGARSMDLLTLQAGGFHVLSLTIRRQSGHLILMAATQDMALGMIIVGMQHVANEIMRLLDGASAAA